MRATRWQDWANFATGLWLLVSPWALSYSGTTAATNAHFVGAGIVAFAAIAAYMPRVWHEVVNIVFGVWLVLSPFVLGFAALPSLALHTVLAGILATAFAIWAMFSAGRIDARWHRGRSA